MGFDSIKRCCSKLYHLQCLSFCLLVWLSDYICVYLKRLFIILFSFWTRSVVRDYVEMHNLELAFDYAAALTVIGMDRLTAIGAPFHHQIYISHGKLIFQMGLSWFLPMIFIIVNIIFFATQRMDYVCMQTLIYSLL